MIANLSVDAPVFQLDFDNQCLLRCGEELAVRPKTFGVLCHLVKRRGQLVTKAELLDVVWAESHVSDIVLKVSIRELRRAFEDQPRDPRFIETLYRRGYRFIGPIAVVDAKLPNRGPSADPGPVDLPCQQVLETLDQLCRREFGEALMPLLHRHAPSWLDRLRLLHSPGDEAVEPLFSEHSERLAAELDALMAAALDTSMDLLLLSRQIVRCRG